jgi:hypothetical protein
MHNPKSCSILEHSLEIVALARPLVDAVQRRDRDLASQLRRAISSVVLNLAEGFGSESGCITGNMDISFDGDGEYRVGGCNLAHFLGAKGCESNTDCNPLLTCTGGICIQP